MTEEAATPTPDEASTEDAPPPFPSLDGTGNVPTVKTPIRHARDIVKEDPRPTAASADLGLAAPSILPPPVIQPIPEPLAPPVVPPAGPFASDDDVILVPQITYDKAGYPELYDGTADVGMEKTVRKAKRGGPGGEGFDKIRIAIVALGSVLLVFLGYVVYSTLFAGSGDKQAGTSTSGMTFVLPATPPASLVGQPLSQTPADKPITDQFVAQFKATGNQHYLAGMYGPTPRVTGTNFFVYGADLTAAEKSDLTNLTTLTAKINENAVALAGRGAVTAAPEVKPVTGPYGGNTYCQTAAVTGAPPATFCYWTDGTYYVGVGQATDGSNSANFTNQIVAELGRPAASAAATQ